MFEQELQQYFLRKYPQENFNCHELDEQLDDFNKRKEENRPFYFALGKIIDSKGL